MSEEFFEDEGPNLVPAGFMLAPQSWAALLAQAPRGQPRAPPRGGRLEKLPVATAPCHLPVAGGSKSSSALVGGPKSSTTSWVRQLPKVGGSKPGLWGLPQPHAWQADALGADALGDGQGRAPRGAAATVLPAMAPARADRERGGQAEIAAADNLGLLMARTCSDGRLPRRSSQGRMTVTLCGEAARSLVATKCDCSPSVRDNSEGSTFTGRSPHKSLRGSSVGRDSKGATFTGSFPHNSLRGSSGGRDSKGATFTGGFPHKSLKSSNGGRDSKGATFTGGFPHQKIVRGAPTTLPALPKRGTGESVDSWDSSAPRDEEARLAAQTNPSLVQGSAQAQEQERTEHRGEEPRARSPPALGPTAESADVEEAKGMQLDDTGEPVVKFALTMQEALNRYKGEYHTEQRRVQITFERFSADDGEVNRDSLHHMLLNLGFLTSSSSLAKQLASEMFNFASIDFADFAEFVSRFQQHERQAVNDAAVAWLAQEQQARTPAGLRDFLRSVGVAVDDAGAARMLDAGCPGKELATLELRDLLRVVAACRVNEGFTGKELETARATFEKLHEEFGVLCRGWSDIAVRVSALPTGMISFFTIYGMRHFQELLKRLPNETERTQGVCFYEYVVWLRRLRDLDTKETWRVFSKMDTEGSCSLPVAGVRKVAETLGFTLVGDVVDELLEEIGVPAGDKLDFGAVLRFMRACRECHGFSSHERKLHRADFDKFDPEGAGELTNSKVLNLLRYMGQTVRVDEVWGLIDMVDFNKNGTMDLDEFLTLMRLMREKEVALAQKAFDKLRAGAQGLPLDRLAEALTLVFEKPPLQTVVQEMLANVTTPPEFDHFWTMVCSCRVRSALLSRQRGGFSEKVFGQIEEVFKGGGTTPRASIKIGELIGMLSESKFPVNTPDGRKDLLKRLAAARAHAIDTGVPERDLGPANSEKVAFYTCVHLIRGIVREVEEAAMAREEEVLATTRFTTDEVNEFRQVFTEIALSGKGKQSKISLGGLLDQLAVLPVIREQDMMKMLKTLGMRVSLKQLQELNAKIREATASVKNHPVGAVDFVCFLRVIHWMLDTDYAGVNHAAARASEAAPKKPPRFDGRVQARALARVQARALVKSTGPSSPSGLAP